MKSSSQHMFSVAPQVSIPRASFKRNYTYKTTFNAGQLIPIVLDEVLPGDTFNLKLSSFARVLSALKYPIMDNLYMDFQFFYVPVRLVYDDYEKFFGSSAGPEGKWQYDDSHLMPGITAPQGGWQVGSIADYFGIPTGVPNIRVNALPFRCYNRVIQDWYRPSTYELDEVPCKTDATDDTSDLYPIQKRLKRCDYFTASLIAPQRGPGVDLPLGDFAPVITRSEVSNASPSTALQWTNSSTGDLLIGGTRYPTILNLQSGSSYSRLTEYGQDHGGSKSDYVTPRNLWTDLSQATAISINSMRQAFQLQKALERDQRGGVRYVSQLLSHFGVRSPDARLQRSEFLGGGSTPIQIHTVANTNGASGSTQAELAAYAVSGQNKVGFVKSFVEHGYIIGLVSVRADLTYQQGIPRMFDRFARFDFYYPVFGHLGEQTILNKEIYAQGTDQDNEVFGYQERFAEYRYGVSKITGQLRSTYEQSLDSWHLAQKFNNLPVLNQEFLEENVPMSRVKAVTTAPDFVFDSLVSLNCVRPMSLFGVPGWADHF